PEPVRPLLGHVRRPVLRPACPGAGWAKNRLGPTARRRRRPIFFGSRAGVCVSPCAGLRAPGRGGLTYHPTLNPSNVHRSPSMSQTSTPDLAATWNRLAQKVADQHWPVSALYVV